VGHLDFGQLAVTGKIHKSCMKMVPGDPGEGLLHLLSGANIGEGVDKYQGVVSEVRTFRFCGTA